MKKYILLLISLFFAAINFNLILKPLSLVTGGTQGLTIVLNYIINLKPSTIILIINIIALTISFFFLTKDNTRSALIASFVYPLFVRLTSNFNFLKSMNQYIFLYAIIAGIICGITGGIIYKQGFSSGGTTVINLLAQKYLHIKIALTHFIVNASIILLGCFYFGIKKGLYSLIVITTSSIIINLILRKKRT